MDTVAQIGCLVSHLPIVPVRRFMGTDKRNANGHVRPFLWLKIMFSFKTTLHLDMDRLGK